MIEKILIAPDSFKESLDAITVAETIKQGLSEVFSDVKFDLAPMADGGEGTCKAIIYSIGGKIVNIKVKGPLGDTIDSFFALLPDGKTAIIEMSAASGLPLVPIDKRNPLKTTTYGTGELIKYALAENVEKIIIGIGGSATNDGGIGALSALGVKFLDKNGNEIEPTGEGLGKLYKIDTTNIDSRIKNTEILIASDVDNPLLGSKGASLVYSPQKGAGPEEVKILEQNLTRYANIIKSELGIDVADIPGAGAAGGLGAGLFAFCNAKIVSGSQLIADIIKLPQRLTNCDLCITGEGKIDEQSLFGKVCIRVAEYAQKRKVPAIAIVGSVGPGAEKCIPPLTAYFSIINRPMTLETALEETQHLIKQASEQIARLLKYTETIKRSQQLSI